MEERKDKWVGDDKAVKQNNFWFSFQSIFRNLASYHSVSITFSFLWNPLGWQKCLRNLNIKDKFWKTTRVKKLSYNLIPSSASWIWAMVHLLDITSIFWNKSNKINNDLFQILWNFSQPRLRNSGLTAQLILVWKKGKIFVKWFTTYDSSRFVNLIM